MLEVAEIEFPSNLGSHVTEDGQLQAKAVEALRKQIEGARPSARGRARAVFGDNPASAEGFIDETVSGTAELVERAIAERAHLVEQAALKMAELGKKVNQTKQEAEAEKGYRALAHRARTDYRHAYLPRVLAEAGVIPGYAFPGDPGSLALGYAPDLVFASRLQAQREFAPGQVVYSRGSRWRVKGLALHRPGALGAAGEPERFAFTECPECLMANPAGSANNCFRCSSELSGGTKIGLDAGAFQAWLEEVEPEAEEERLFLGYDVRQHPQRDAGGKAFRVGEWGLELREQESIWWINHGSTELGPEGDTLAAEGFSLCDRCGRALTPPKPAKSGRKKAAPKDARASQDVHTKQCGGQPAWLAIGHQGHGDTLRVLAPGLAGLGSEGVAWAWSLAYAMLQGAVREFAISPDDIDPVVLTSCRDDEFVVEEVLWADTVVGGSGILQVMTERLPAVAAAALKHLDGHDCPSSCYRCLRSYRNQRLHDLLNWRIVIPQLQALAGSAVGSVGEIAPSWHILEGPEWDQARGEGCGSPQELRLLRAMREGGLPEPARQYEVAGEGGVLITRADFAFPDRHLLVYVDGLAFHSTLRQRVHDSRQTARLQSMGWKVLRFLGAEVHGYAAGCARKLLVEVEGEGAG